MTRKAEYLSQIDHTDGSRLAEAAYRTLKEYLPKLLRIEEKDWSSEGFQTNLRESFTNTIKEAEDEEAKVVFTEEEIRNAFLLGGENLFVAMYQERIPSADTKKTILAELTLKHLPVGLAGELAVPEGDILIGLIKNALQQEIDVIKREKSLQKLEEINKFRGGIC